MSTSTDSKYICTSDEKYRFGVPFKLLTKQGGLNTKNIRTYALYMYLCYYLHTVYTVHTVGDLGSLWQWIRSTHIEQVFRDWPLNV